MIKKVVVLSLFPLVLQGISGERAVAQVGFKPSHMPTISGKKSDRQPPSSRQQIQLSYAPVVKYAAPAVVNIFASRKVAVRSDPFAMNPLMDDFFGRNPFFNNPLSNRLGRTKQKVVNSLGSGVIIADDGLILTNYHVIARGEDIKIVLSDKREFAATAVMADKETDLALLRIDTKGERLPYLPFAEGEDLEVGDLVLAIGNPYGIGQTVTSGIVSALARTAVGVTDYEFFIQTDAAINPGNSGGALVNMHGKLVGINTAIYSKSGGSTGIGFATPVIMAQLLVNSHAIGANRVIRPWLGTSTQDLTQELATNLRLKTPKGVLINKIYPGSPADEAGLQREDVIVGIDGQEVADERGFKFLVALKKIGTKAKLSVMRNGVMRRITVDMETPKEDVPRAKTTLYESGPLSGVTVENLSPAVAHEMGMERMKGVVIKTIDAGTAASGFFRVGDVIESVNGQRVQTVKELKKVIANAERTWKIVANRGGQLLTVSVRM